MPQRSVHQRRRDYVMRQNPGFFGKNAGKQPTREAVASEYDRLIVAAQHDRNPAAGKERPESPNVAVTPPLKVTRGASDLIRDVEAFLTIDEGYIDHKGKDLSGTKQVHEATTEHEHTSTGQPQTTVDNGLSYESTFHAGNDQSEYIVPAECIQKHGESHHFSDNGNAHSWLAMESESCAEQVDQPATQPLDADNAQLNSWHTIASSRPRRSLVSRENDAPNGNGCFNCGMQGHRKADCPEPTKNNGRACHKCGEEGHLARECPSQEYGGYGDRLCFKCNEPGHISRECPKGGGGGRNRGCFNCGEEGHKANECPNTKNDYGKRGGNGRLRSGRCRECGKEGHEARNCLKVYDNFELETSTLNGFDTGASLPPSTLNDDDAGIW